jgi:hypothetical protein
MARHLLAKSALFLCIVCGVITNTAIALDTYIEDTDRFPGWKGELPSVANAEYTDESVGYGEVGKVRFYESAAFSSHLLIFFLSTPAQPPYCIQPPYCTNLFCSLINQSLCRRSGAAR